MRNGILCALLANINRDPKKGKPFAPSDFMPFEEKPKTDGVAGFGSFVASIKTNLKPSKKRDDLVVPERRQIVK